MKSTFILFIGEKIVQLYKVKDAKVTLIAKLENLTEKAQIQNIFESHPKQSLRILIDNAALEFSATPLPKMTFWDRILHLKHKRDLLGTEVIFKDVRSQDGLLLQGYAKSSPWIEGWLRDLHYDSLSFLPYEMKAYGEFLNPAFKKSAWMFLHIGQEGFLRQTLYTQGHVLSARFTRIPPNLKASERPNFVIKDTIQAITYLNKKGANLPLNIPGFSILPFALEEFSLTPLDSFDSFLAWWALRKPSLNLQPLNVKAPSPTQIRLGLRVASATVAGLLLLGMGSDVYDIYKLSQLSKRLEIQTGQLTFARERLEDEVASYDIAAMKTQMSTYEEVLKETHNPLDALKSFSQIMEKNPEIHILNFDWENNPQDKLVKLTLHIKTSEEDDRDVISDLFRDFHTSAAEHLGAAKVTVLKSPFNASDSGIFSGSTRVNKQQKDLHEKTGLVEVKWGW